MNNLKKSDYSTLFSAVRMFVVPFIVAAITFAATGPSPAQAAAKLNKVTIILD